VHGRSDCLVQLLINAYVRFSCCLLRCAVDACQVELIIRDIMDKKLKKAKFDDQKCKVLALELCTEIKEKVKDLNIPRYKVVLQSVIGEVKGQGAYIASRCLWDTETDNYASFSMKNVRKTKTRTTPQ
jgi:hypothetical protein